MQMDINLIEIKARIPALEPKRKKILEMGGKMDGTYNQEDTYFNSPKGRLKLREIENEVSAKLIYYERSDIPNPKESNVSIYDTNEPKILKELLNRVLGTKVIVIKKREIYRYRGTQIHLDSLEKLGTFIEFERPLKDLSKDRLALQELMIELKIRKEDLLKGSYSDLIIDENF
jgi:predicted adenylyl cyclase CyaB